MLWTVAILLALSAHAVEPDAVAQRAIEGTNAFRKEQGLTAVESNAELTQAAQGFARYMAKTGKYGHTADGRRPSERASAAGYEYCVVAENIAYQYSSRGYESAAELGRELVEGWKNSPEHRKNMLDPVVTETGVGIAQGEEGRWFAVQMFGLPRSAQTRFTVANRSGERVTYQVGERKFSLGPRVSRTHSICRPAELSIRDIQEKPSDGARYVVRDDGVEVR